MYNSPQVRKRVRITPGYQKAERKINEIETTDILGRSTKTNAPWNIHKLYKFLQEITTIKQEERQKHSILGKKKITTDL